MKITIKINKEKEKEILDFIKKINTEFEENIKVWFLFLIYLLSVRKKININDYLLPHDKIFLKIQNINDNVINSLINIENIHEKITQTRAIEEIEYKILVNEISSKIKLDIQDTNSIIYQTISVLLENQTELNIASSFEEYEIYFLFNFVNILIENIKKQILEIYLKR
ncbi:MAG: hypothetical protein N2505_00430 [Endomicrobia bacterium]|nr:hypothetical protein [Endomicrobiia bacterium]